MTNSRFASVQLTLLSVIVALILENLLNQVTGDTTNSLLMWLQAALIATTVITLWSGFALILTVSDRQPAPVDFVYPFGLLVSLSLAAGAMGKESLLAYFTLVALSGAFSIWALNTELQHLKVRADGQTDGVRRAVLVQWIDGVLMAVVAAVLVLTSLPSAVILGVLLLSIAIEIVAAIGTMRGWRSVAFSEQNNTD